MLIPRYLIPFLLVTPFFLLVGCSTSPPISPPSLAICAGPEEVDDLHDLWENEEERYPDSFCPAALNTRGEVHHWVFAAPFTPVPDYGSDLDPSLWMPVMPTGVIARDLLPSPVSATTRSTPTRTPASTLPSPTRPSVPHTASPTPTSRPSVQTTSARPTAANTAPSRANPTPGRPAPTRAAAPTSRR
jgi:hypothetical protein